MGGSLTLSGSQLFSCAKRSGVKKWKRPVHTSGECFKFVKKEMTRFFNLTNSDKASKQGWQVLNTLGEASLMSSDGDLVLGLPLGRRWGITYKKKCLPKRLPKCIFS